MIGSLATGYGGLDRAAEAVLGLTTAWVADNDPGAAKILAHRFDVPNLGDVTAVDWTEVEPVDVLTAGYPCQPFSHAGKRAGEDDPRNLWPHVLRAVRHLRPRLVLLENVAGHLSLGFGRVLGDLAALGYDARWTCLRAADVGAPHGRLRVFIAAHPGCQRHGGGEDTGAVGRADGADAGQTWQRQRAWPVASGRSAPAATDTGRGSLAGSGAARVGLRVAAERGVVAVADAAGATWGGAEPDDLASAIVGTAEPRERTSANHAEREVAWGVYAPAIARWEHVIGRPAPAPTEPGRNGPRLSPRFVEWLMGLDAGWVTDVPGLARNAQLKALGNGVVPQQAGAALRWLLTESLEESA